MDPFGDVAELYVSLRRIPTYVLIMMIFTVLQFLVISAVGIFAAVQMHKIASVLERSQTQSHQALGAGQYPQQFRPGQQPPQYGSQRSS